MADRLDALGARLQGRQGGRRMRRDTLHMTLCFVGEVAVDSVGRLEEVGDAVVQPAFEFIVDQVGFWPDKRIVWAGCSGETTAATLLADGLSAALRERGFNIDRRSFRPHVTLLRKAVRPPEPEAITVEALAWSAREFVLVASERDHVGSRYRRLASWPLLGTAVGPE